MGNDDRELSARQRKHSLELGQSITRSLMRGDREVQVMGYGPTPATTIVTSIVNPDDEGRLFAHALGFHDAMLRDGGGYKVPTEFGREYEEGHRLGAEENRERLLPAPRETQSEDAS